MKFTAICYFFLVGVQTTLILASQWNTTTVSPLFNVTTNDTNELTTMSTENMTEISTTDLIPSEGQNFTTETPAHNVPGGTPPPPSRPPPAPTTPTPMKPTTKSRMLDMPTPTQPSSGGSDTVGIIIIVVILAIALLVGLICYVSRNKGRRYSVDFTSRPEEAQIPLSTGEPEAPVEVVSLNGLQFEGTEGSTQEPQETHETEAKLDDQMEQKAEPEKVTVDACTDSAAPPADASEDQPKQDVPEPSPAAPVEPSGGEQTDDEGAASKQTPVESLKERNEANENNSNNTAPPQRGARDDLFHDSMV